MVLAPDGDLGTKAGAWGGHSRCSTMKYGIKQRRELWRNMRKTYIERQKMVKRRRKAE